jgi:hypothetical protein
MELLDSLVPATPTENFLYFKKHVILAEHFTSQWGWITSSKWMIFQKYQDFYLFKRK